MPALNETRQKFWVVFSPSQGVCGRYDGRCEADENARSMAKKHMHESFLVMESVGGFSIPKLEPLAIDLTEEVCDV